MIISQQPIIRYNKHGLPKKNPKIMASIKCDECSAIYEDRLCNALHRRKRNILSNGKDLCKTCAVSASKKKLANVGAKYLKSRTQEDRIKHAIIGGKSNKGITNSGQFSSEKWKAKSLEEQQHIVRNASNALQEKLKDPVFAREHYNKVLKGRIGFVSSGQSELFDYMKEYGFELEVIIDRIQVDMCHKGDKIVVEFNGDAYHCNPKKYNSDFYSSLIRMTAGEKWEKDRQRTYFLQSLGYRVIVIWESEWKESKINCLNKIKEIIDYETEKNRKL